MFSDKLKKYRKKIGLTRESLAHRINKLYGFECSGANVQNWENGTNPKMNMVVALADVLGIPEQFLFDDSDRAVNKIVDSLVPNYQSFTEHTKKVSLIEGYVGAGSAGYLSGEVNIIDYLYVDNYMIKKGYNFDAIKALIVLGDSMVPYVDNDDIVLFSELSDNSYNLSDGKYIITTINGTMVKNLAFRTNGDISISSCNRSYSEEIIKMSESQEYLDIIGVVVGRILKS